MMKIKRQSKIIEFISNNEVETQEELGDMLRRAGFEVTQATISRDIRELKLTKISCENGSQKYSALSSVVSQFSERFVRIFKDGVVSLNYANNIIVVKTYEGMAMAVAACIDAMSFWEILGCIAGDNTIFCAVRSEDAAVSIIEKFKSIINEE